MTVSPMAKLLAPVARERAAHVEDAPDDGQC